jgi:hypothetical protein
MVLQRYYGASQRNAGTHYYYHSSINIKEITMRTLLALCAVFAVMLASIGCSVAPPLSQQEAAMMLSEAMGAAMYEGTASTGKAMQTTVIDYTNLAGTAHITGTLHYNDTNPSIFDYSLDCVFTNLEPPVPQNVSSISGTFNMTYNFTDTPAIAFDMTYLGALDIVYKGTSYACTWNFGYSYTGTTFTSTGNYSVNGYSYSFSYSGSI